VAAGLLETAAQVVLDGLRGERLTVDEEEMRRRKATCQACKFFDRAARRCAKCGCFMSLKVHFKPATCPMGTGTRR
jgi:hypothetical protein